MINKRLKKYRVVLLYLFLSLIFLAPILTGNGLPFRYDWVWPIFNTGQFWDGLTTGNSLGVFSALSKNGPAVLGVLGMTYLPPLYLFKIFIFLIHFVAGYGFYRFIRERVQSETVAIVSGLAYALTPYIFIRTIIGFVWSMLAYALLPVFLLKYFEAKKKIFDYLIIGFLFSLIFGQIQAGLLTFLIISIYSVLSLFTTDSKKAVKNYIFTLISLFVFALPWLSVIFFKKQTLATVSGGAATTLDFISSLPHSYRNFIMLSDHHITSDFFNSLGRDKLFLAGWLVVWFVSACVVFNKKNRTLALTFLVSSLLVLPFIKGPLGVFGHFYIWFYDRVPQIAVFRETYHFEFLFAISISVLFALGLDWLWQKIDNQKKITLPRRQAGKIQGSDGLISLLLTGLKAISAGSIIFIISPYLTFDYAGYLKLQKIPAEYNQLNIFLKENKNYCQKIYYPPGLGFLYFKNDNLKGASNADTFASSVGIPHLTDGASVLSVPSEEMFYRNEIVSQFYERSDDGRFVDLLNEGGVDCLILRLNMETRYDQASNLWREKDPVILKKWNNIDLLSLAKTKKGMKLEKQFGENIFIYKIDSNKVQDPGLGTRDSGLNNLEPVAWNQRPRTYLPLTDWANNFAYYRDGWSRGRYDFWRKHLFTQLRQDFIYTDKPDSTLTGKISENGSYELWVRYLDGGGAGRFKIIVNNMEFVVQKEAGAERFAWKILNEVKINGNASFEITNLSGENAISDLVLIKND